MREHPIPQDVTNYKFHIVGNMTLKQFVEIASGVILAVVIYQTNLLTPVKYTLMLISFLLGLAVAFVPIEERPLDHWIITFIKILYKPTKFFWRRTPKIPDAFLFKLNDESTSLINEVDLSPARKQRIHEYLGSINNDNDPYAWTADEQEQMSDILKSFDTVTVSHTTIVQTKQKPNLDVRVRNLAIPYGEQPPQTQATNQTNYQVMNQRNKLDTSDVASNVAIPETELISVDQKVVSDEDNTTDDTNVQHGSEHSSFLHGSEQPEVQSANTDSIAVSHNVDLPFPTKPSEPNKIVGMVLTPDNKLVVGAIVEIKDLSGNIVRAVKTNLLGQFFVTTPLKNGEYLIDVEDKDKTFNTQQIKLKGKIVDPVEIRSN